MFFSTVYRLYKIDIVDTVPHSNPMSSCAHSRLCLICLGKWAETCEFQTFCEFRSRCFTREICLSPPPWDGCITGHIPAAAWMCVCAGFACVASHVCAPSEECGFFLFFNFNHPPSAAFPGGIFPDSFSYCFGKPLSTVFPSALASKHTWLLWNLYVWQDIHSLLCRRV